MKPSRSLRSPPPEGGVTAFGRQDGTDAAHDGLRIAILGAESTGKTALAQALVQRLRDDTGLRVTWIPEYLREWCERSGRTPRPEEQAGIADEQGRRIDEAAASHDVVLCDTTPLMVSVYSEFVFADRSLHPRALAWHARCALTLVTALDLPWQADGLQREGPHVQAPIDALVRGLLIGAELPWATIAGAGERRLEAALDAIAPLLRPLPQPGRGLFTRLAERDADASAARWTCENCDSPDCEHALRRSRPGTSRGA
jgi:nicotinamide riboside kinase